MTATTPVPEGGPQQAAVQGKLSVYGDNGQVPKLMTEPCCGMECANQRGRPYTPHYFVWHDKDGCPDLWVTSSLPTSELAAAVALQAMCEEAGSPVLCGYQTGRWFAFDGTVYVVQDGLFASRMTGWLAAVYERVLSELETAIRQQVIRAMGIETPRKDVDEVTRRELARWKPHRAYFTRLCSEHGQAALARQAGRTCGADEQDLDAETGEIAVTLGRISHARIMADRRVVLLRTGPGRLVTRRTAPGLAFDPQATCPVFDRFMETSVADRGQRDWLLWRAASSLFGLMPRKGFANLIGEHDSGKSTFAGIMMHLAGDYAITVPVKTFLAKHSGDSGFREAELRGARRVFAQEPQPGGRYDDGFMKAITGRDRQRTAGKWEKPVEWVPQCTPFIGSNSPIRFASSDEAMLERHEPVRFARGYAEMDPALPEKLKAELPGILNRLLSYAVREAQWGPPPLPASMAAEREKLVTETEDALAFVAEQIENGILAETPGLPVSRYAPVTWLFQRYQAWCADTEGIRQPLGRKTFSKIVGRRYPVQVSNGYRFCGLAAPGASQEG